MSLSKEDALAIIEEIKQRDTFLGRDMSRWWTYETHIKTSAFIAQKIASKIDEMDENQAYVSALLHDICRTTEKQQQRFHGISGYEMLIKKDENAARASLLHMFIYNNLPPYEQCSQMFFSKKQDYDFIFNYIHKTDITDYDLLIQLSDNLSNKYGFVTLEQRAQDLTERRGITLSPEWFEIRYQLKSHFDQILKEDVYTLFKSPCSISKQKEY